MPATPPRVRLRPRLRVYVGDRRALGPGKADLLAAIEREGSLAAAARALGMSYMRAWRLVREMHELFRAPLVELRRGAAGGAALTRAGVAVLELYRAMEAAADRAVAPLWAKLRRRLRAR
jgi:molybdate transport system regulatory protein